MKVRAECVNGHILAIGGGPDSVDRFPICAAVRKNDAELKQAIDRAFAELAKSGKLGEVFARWHIPFEHSKVLKEGN